MTDQPTRLNKYLAFQLGISRREADDLIEQGRVTLSGETAKLGAQIIPPVEVEVDGKLIASSQQYAYLLLNKPVGYVSSRRQQGDIPTIYSLLPEQYHHLKPVGRLDKDSSGLILLTNDGDFAYRMTHPQFHKVKIYTVELDHPLEPLHQQMISDYGVMLDDGKSQFLVEKTEPAKHERAVRASGGGTESANSLRTEVEGLAPTYSVTMHEGRNRQIRRTFGALGYQVTTLHRTNFGNYSLGDIKPSEFEITTIR